MRKIKTQPYFSVPVQKNESEKFMQDLWNGANNLHHKKSRRKLKYLFFRTVVLSFITVGLALFFLYTSWYFVEHQLLHWHGQSSKV